MSYFNIYHMARCVCVFENFNCIVFGGWTLILGRRTFTKTGGTPTNFPNNSSAESWKLFMQLHVNSDYLDAT